MINFLGKIADSIRFQFLYRRQTALTMPVFMYIQDLQKR